MRISSPATAKEDSTRDFSLAASPSSVENGFVFSNRFFSENRVWGSAFENRTLTGASTWLSSTTRPGCGYRCGGIASVSTVQRYYASSYGRFNTADSLASSAMADDPGSWNKYAYVGGDPVNRNDKHGLCWVDSSGNYADDWDYNDAIYSGQLNVDASYVAGDCSDVVDGSGDDSPDDGASSGPNPCMSQALLGATCTPPSTAPTAPVVTVASTSPPLQSAGWVSPKFLSVVQLWWGTSRDCKTAHH
jgi:RHS repeat-associated protein